MYFAFIKGRERAREREREKERAQRRALRTEIALPSCQVDFASLQERGGVRLPLHQGLEDQAALQPGAWTKCAAAPEPCNGKSPACEVLMRGLGGVKRIASATALF